MNSSTPGFLPVNLVRKLHSYADEHLRRGLLREALRDMVDHDILAFIGYLVCRTDAADSRRVYLDLTLELLADGPWDSQRFALVADYPAIRERQPVLAFLGIDDARRAKGGGTFGPWAMEEVPLGVRKSRARSQNPDILLVLTADPDPSVVRILLDNPRVTESLALRVASRRPQRATMFIELVRSRFIASETFQNAIVNNPYCPTRIAVALVPLLSRVHRIEIAGSASVDPAVSQAAAAMNL